jgi:hypothetical protein
MITAIGSQAAMICTGIRPVAAPGIELIAGGQIVMANPIAKMPAASNMPNLSNQQGIQFSKVNCPQVVSVVEAV